MKQSKKSFDSILNLKQKSAENLISFPNQKVKIELVFGFKLKRTREVRVRKKNQ